MEFKIKFNDKERHILYSVLAYVLSISYMATGLYAVSHFTNIGLINKTWQLLIAVGLHFSQWLLVARAVFKHYQ